ncbi:MAG: helix-turn-helix domain-containing protein [Enterovibrio sp.]
MKNSILDVMHETAQGLHDAGVMPDLTMREFDALCLPKLEEFTPSQIIELRHKLKASQPVFAMFLNVTSSTVKQWEQGKKRPRGSALKLLNLVAKKGLEALA